MKKKKLKKLSVVTAAKWLEASRALLREEKAFFRARERIAACRHALPWVKVETPYEFHAPAGRGSLAGLFAGRSQLIVYHFMLAPAGRKAAADVP